MIPSKDFVYCPTCRYEICLAKCDIVDVVQDSFVPKFSPLSNNVEGYEKKTVKLKRYLCPNDGSVVKEEEV